MNHVHHFPIYVKLKASKLLFDFFYLPLGVDSQANYNLNH